MNAVPGPLLPLLAAASAFASIDRLAYLEVANPLYQQGLVADTMAGDSRAVQNFSIARSDLNDILASFDEEHGSAG